jgi:hypothetical protein
LYAQALASAEKGGSSQSALSIAENNAIEAECLALLDAARSHQSIGSSAAAGKRWATSLDAYSKAGQESTQALSACSGDNQTKAQALIDKGVALLKHPQPNDMGVALLKHPQPNDIYRHC